MHFLFYSLSLYISLSHMHTHTDSLFIITQSIMENHLMTGKQVLGSRQRDLQVVPAAGGPVWSWHPASLMEKPPPREAIWKHSETSTDKASLVSSLSVFLLCSSVSWRLFFPFDQSRRLIFKQKLISYVSLNKSLATQGFSCSEKWSFLGLQ